MIFKVAQTLYQLGSKNIRTLRRCSTLAKRAENEKIYEVSPRCTLNGFVSYKMILMPHDVNNTSETDRVVLKCPKEVTVNQIGTSLNLTTAGEPLDQDTVCELHVPLKANINLTALGDVKVGDLQGDGMRVFSEMGSVTLGNLKCSEVHAGTNDKDIIVEGTLEASRIEFLCRQAGSIQAQKIKSLGLKLDTNEGNINMSACYSKNAYFVTRTGSMNLKNVHNRCRIEILKKGAVKMLGFEGALEVSLQNGAGDFQIEKLFADSDILVRGEGEITLRITKELLKYVQIIVWSKGCFVDDEIPYTEDDLKDMTTIRQEGVTPEHVMRIRCPKANCNVRLASWADMVEKQILEKKEKDVQSIKQQKQVN